MGGGHNLAFYNTFGFKNMEEFREQYDRIADFFNDPNYEIFAKSDELWLCQLERSSQYMMNNIESLLDLAQMQTGRLSLDITEFKPMGELESLLRHYEYEARQRGIAPKENLGWLMQLGAFESHPCRFVMLVDEEEVLPERVRQVIDYTLKKPLLPSRISKHLTQVLQLPVRSVEKPQGGERKIKALVVEDNIINQRLTKLLLEEYNLSVTVAANGHDAVELCRKYPFDVIFMDIDMPVKDGIAATHEIRKLPLFREHPAPIIAVTALVMEGDRERILGEGLYDYLAKPLGREKLEGILERYLSKPALS
ncbi:MAG: response regulator [Campylobacterales bacterium]|nr:response regulator [Campylobacterales bacterium]